MSAGKRFRLERATLSLETRDGKLKTMPIPAGAIVQILPGPITGGLVTVLWEGRSLQMFAADVQARGTEIEENSAGA